MLERIPVSTNQIAREWDVGLSYQSEDAKVSVEIDHTCNLISLFMQMILV